MTMRVGIIGAGGIAAGAHIPNYQNYGPNVEVLAISNHNKERAEVLAEQFSIPSVFENYQDMLDEMKLDAVSICTPNKFHAEQTIAALLAGCHVLCEKPPAITPEEAALMEDISKKTGRILVYGFHYRYSPEVQTLKRFIQEDELGEIYAGTVKAVRRRGIPGWGVFANKELQGGGPLIDIGVHMLDSALYLMGYPEPDTVFGTAYQKLGNRKGVGLLGDWDWENFTVEDMARGMITFKNGSSLLLETAFAANIEASEEMQVSLMGEKGGANLFPLKIFQEKHGTLIDIQPVFLPKRNMYKEEIHHFINAILEGKQNLSTPRQGVILQNIVHALYESALKGEAVKLEL